MDPALRAARLSRRARWCLSNGISCLPTIGKVSAISAWLHLTKRHPTGDEIDEWFAPDAIRQEDKNLAIIAGAISNLICIDTDSRDIAVNVFRELPRTSMMTKTPRGGVHFWFKLGGQVIRPRVKIGGLACDLRGENSYALCSPSKGYEQIGDCDLSQVPIFEPSWLESITSDSSSSRLITRKKINHVPQYISRVQSVQGQNGSAGLVRAAWICHDANYSEPETLLALQEWNRGVSVSPPWTDKELVRAVIRVFKKGKCNG